MSKGSHARPNHAGRRLNQIAEQRAAVTASVLRCLANRPNILGGLKTLLSALEGATAAQMGLYGDLAEEMRKTIRAWIATRERGLVVL